MASGLGSRVLVPRAVGSSCEGRILAPPPSRLAPYQSQLDLPIVRVLDANMRPHWRRDDEWTGREANADVPGRFPPEPMHYVRGRLTALAASTTGAGARCAGCCRSRARTPRHLPRPPAAGDPPRSRPRRERGSSVCVRARPSRQHLTGTAGLDPKQQLSPIAPSPLRTTRSAYAVSQPSGQGSLHASNGN